VTSSIFSAIPAANEAPVVNNLQYSVHGEPTNGFHLMRRWSVTPGMVVNFPKGRRRPDKAPFLYRAISHRVRPLDGGDLRVCNGYSRARIRIRNPDSGSQLPRKRLDDARAQTCLDACGIGGHSDAIVGHG
jgi:hypothetical protein